MTPPESRGAASVTLDTIRGRLEAIRVALTLGEHLRADQHATAAITLIDNADSVHEICATHPADISDRWRLIPDPEQDA